MMIKDKREEEKGKLVNGVFLCVTREPLVIPHSFYKHPSRIFLGRVSLLISSHPALFPHFN